MTLIEMLRANGSWEADAAVTTIQVRDMRIEKLEAELHSCFHRIEELQAALRSILQYQLTDETWVKLGFDPKKIRAEFDAARKALEGKDD